MNVNPDISQQNVINISQQKWSQQEWFCADFGDGIDEEVANILNWLGQEQGISPKLALKKAVATAAYLHDVTKNQGGELLVKRKDNSVGRIVLK